MCLAVPGQIETIFESHGTRMGKVNFGGVVKEVCLAYLPDIRIGDYTIVHVGFAISQIDEASAQETLRTFRKWVCLTTNGGAWASNLRKISKSKTDRCAGEGSTPT